MALVALRGSLPADGGAGIDRRWVYGIGVRVVGASLWWFRRDYGELAAQMRPDVRETLLAAAVGLAVFACWIRLDAPWMTIGTPMASFRPLDAAGGIAWPPVPGARVSRAAPVPRHGRPLL